MAQASRGQSKKLGTSGLTHLQMEVGSDRSSWVQAQKEGCLYVDRLGGFVNEFIDK